MSECTGRGPGPHLPARRSGHGQLLAFFSANHIGPDAALEFFLLAPRSAGNATAAGGAATGRDRPRCRSRADLYTAAAVGIL
jgi:hypothetical protein